MASLEVPTIQQIGTAVYHFERKYKNRLDTINIRNNNRFLCFRLEW